MGEGQGREVRGTQAPGAKPVLPLHFQLLAFLLPPTPLPPPVVIFLSRTSIFQRLLCKTNLDHSRCLSPSCAGMFLNEKAKVKDLDLGEPESCALSSNLEAV